MNKFSLDFNDLNTRLDKQKNKVFKLNEVKDRIRKVAFDVVRFVDGNDEFKGLWQIRKDDSGEYIIAMYEDEQGVTKSSSNWSVIPDSGNKNITFFYKNRPILKKATASLGVPATEYSEVISSLPERLENNKKLAAALLLEMPFSERMSLLNDNYELKSLSSYLNSGLMKNAVGFDLPAIIKRINEIVSKINENSSYERRSSPYQEYSDEAKEKIMNLSAAIVELYDFMKGHKMTVELLRGPSGKRVKPKFKEEEESWGDSD